MPSDAAAFSKSGRVSAFDVLEGVGTYTAGSPAHARETKQPNRQMRTGGEGVRAVRGWRVAGAIPVLGVIAMTGGGAKAGGSPASTRVGSGSITASKTKAG